MPIDVGIEQPPSTRRRRSPGRRGPGTRRAGCSDPSPNSSRCLRPTLNSCRLASVHQRANSLGWWLCFAVCSRSSRPSRVRRSAWVASSTRTTVIVMFVCARLYPRPWKGRGRSEHRGRRARTWALPSASGCCRSEAVLSTGGSGSEREHRAASASEPTHPGGQSFGGVVLFPYGRRWFAEETPRAKPAMNVRRPASPWRIIRAWLALNAGRATGDVTFRSRLWVVTSWS